MCYHSLKDVDAQAQYIIIITNPYTHIRVGPMIVTLFPSMTFHHVAELTNAGLRQWKEVGNVESKYRSSKVQHPILPSKKKPDAKVKRPWQLINQAGKLPDY